MTADFDYLNPDYSEIYRARSELLNRLESDPKMYAVTRAHYATHPWDFINDWGMTYDPMRLGTESHETAEMPFLLWDKQWEYLQWVYGQWASGDRGLVEKSRECGVTWLSVGYAVSMWLFVPGFAVGFGSRKADLVDNRGDPKCIFDKIRYFIDRTPAIFIPKGWNPRLHDKNMTFLNPETGSSIIGEAGTQIGRGARCSIYFIDEAAYVEHQEEVDRALAMTTNCQIDISTPNGSGNEFYRKRQRFNNTKRIFIFDWRDDPRKDDAWYAKVKANHSDITVAQEVDRDYNAAQEDAFIEAKWVVASIDAHVKLGFHPTGIKVYGFDPADVGDAKAGVMRHGSVVTGADQIIDGDITQAIPWAINQAQSGGADIFCYDGDGMGAPSMKLAAQSNVGLRMQLQAYHGSAAVEDPKNKYGGEDKNDPLLKTNLDSFKNYRAQTWTWVRDRFKATYDAIERHNLGYAVNVSPDNLISLSPDCKCLLELQSELSRPKRVFTPNGQIKVEAKADMSRRGIDSPNLADALIIAMSTRRPKKVRHKILVRTRRMTDSAVGY